MGLAPYGNPNDQQTKDFVETIKKYLVDIKEDGSIWLDQKYFNYATGLRMVSDKKWEALFGFPRREDENDLKQYHCNLALAIQQVTEEIVIKMAKEAKRITNSEFLCMAGGVALNCVANGKLLRENIFKEIYIQPAAGDAAAPAPSPRRPGADRLGWIRRPLRRHRRHRSGPGRLAGTPWRRAA